MLYLLTALFQEAKPYIDIYHLKRSAAPGGIQLYEGDGCRLVAGGAGPVKAAVAAAFLLTRHMPGHNDVFVNIGTAGSTVFNIGETILCHKIVNDFTKKALYPEMLYKHPFLEGTLGSAGQPAKEPLYELTDMEGAFAYEAALTFLPSSQIHCVKVISDSLCPENVTGGDILKIMSGAAEAVRGWLGVLVEPDIADIITADEIRLMGIVSKNLKLTFEMDRRMREACKQAKIRGADIVSGLSDASGAVTREKSEGKAVFARLINRLTEEV